LTFVLWLWKGDAKGAIGEAAVRAPLFVGLVAAYATKRVSGMSAVSRLISSELYLIMLTFFEMDSQAVEAEIRILELQCASSDPGSPPAYAAVEAETGIVRSTLKRRHDRFVAHLLALVGFVPWLTRERLMNAAEVGDG